VRPDRGVGERARQQQAEGSDADDAGELDAAQPDRPWPVPRQPVRPHDHDGAKQVDERCDCGQDVREGGASGMGAQLDSAAGACGQDEEGIGEGQDASGPDRGASSGPRVKTCAPAFAPDIGRRGWAKILDADQGVLDTLGPASGVSAAVGCTAWLLQRGRRDMNPERLWSRREVLWGATVTLAATMVAVNAEAADASAGFGSQSGGEPAAGLSSHTRPVAVAGPQTALLVGFPATGIFRL
jgi:hypothetical protein